MQNSFVLLTIEKALDWGVLTWFQAQWSLLSALTLSANRQMARTVSKCREGEGMIGVLRSLLVSYSKHDFSSKQPITIVIAYTWWILIFCMGTTLHVDGGLPICLLCESLLLSAPPNLGPREGYGSWMSCSWALVQTCIFLEGWLDPILKSKVPLD